MNLVNYFVLDLSVPRQNYRIEVTGKNIVFRCPPTAKVRVRIDPGIVVNPSEISLFKLPVFKWIEITNEPSDGTLEIWTFHCGAQPDVVARKLDEIVVSLESLITEVSVDG